MAFAYTDGGVFQNQPLGMAKNLVELQVGGHVSAEQRGYLFIAPHPKSSDAERGFSAEKANFMSTIGRLGGAVLGQAEFQDWAMAESVNARIAELNQLATQLQGLFQSGQLQPGEATSLTTKLLSAMFSAGGKFDHAALDAAREQLRTQFSPEYASLQPGQRDAWLDALLVLEIAAHLHEKEEMYIYDFVAEPKRLAGGGLFAFTGFFDVSYRKHDYDYGRVVAQERLHEYSAAPTGVFSGLQWTPRPIDPIDPKLNDLPMAEVPEDTRRQVYKQVMAAVDELLSELGANWIERKAIEALLIRKRIKSMLAL